MFFSVVLPTRHVDKLSMTVLKEKKKLPERDRRRRYSMAYFLKINSYTSTISRALDENFGGLLAVPLLFVLCSALERVPFKPDLHLQQNTEPNLKYVQCSVSVDTKPNSKLQ